MNPLAWACHKGHLQIAKTLAAHGADPLVRNGINAVSRIRGRTVLSWALQQEQREIIKWLLTLKVVFPGEELMEAKKLIAK